MFHHTPKLTAIILSLLVFFSCKKEQHSVVNDESALVTSAQTFFASSIAGGAERINSKNYRATRTKNANWALAQHIQLPMGDAVVVPVVYKDPLFVSSEVSGRGVFNLSDLATLLVYKDSNAIFHYGLVTFVPDSDAVKAGTFTSGLVLYEDWFGNSLSKPGRLRSSQLAGPGGSSTATEVDVVQNIEVCNELDGYNYSSDDPAGGISWSETTCTTYGFQQNPGPFLGRVGLAPIYGARIVSIANIVQGPPHNPIGNITDYIKCFTQGDAGHTFTVTLAVEQPTPNTRQPWSFSDGPVGSSAAGNVFNTGHTWLIFNENTGYGTTTRNVGFYPDDIVTPWSPSAQGVLNDDEGTSYNISLTITVNSSQFFDILSYINDLSGPASTYNLNSFNCTSFAVDALANGDVAVPATVGTWQGNGKGLDPGDLGEDIRGMQLGANMQRNTTSSYHPNVGNCN
jgi:hypothetical protein